ncbi:MAG: hypothetical protein GX051_08220 [Clostridiales bacterium]|nr:hypothetical protein [Clostridiales bacterium]
MLMCIRAAVTVRAAGEYINAPGGNITSSLSASQVAAMFEQGASVAVTDNVVVVKNASGFTVTVKSNMLLTGTVNIGSDVTLQLISNGDYTIKRSFGFGNETSYMFYLSSSTAGLTLGSGSVTAETDTITYYFSNGDEEIWPVGDVSELTESVQERYVTHTKVNTVINNTMTGTLTIDGGAEYERDYTGTGYSFDDQSNSTGNMIKVANGTVTLWSGVTLQNNKTPGVDSVGGSAVNLQSGKIYFYGGTIRRCVSCKTDIFTSGQTGSSKGDGGALLFNSQTAFGYIYDCTITQCESDNSSAISQWGGSTLFFLGGSVYDNFSYGDEDYPAQAISTYSASSTHSSTLYMYGGAISSNDGINHSADIRISSGRNKLNLFGGSIDTLGMNSSDGTVNIYGGQIATLTGKNDDNITSTVVYSYPGGSKLQTVTIENSVNATGNQTVQVKATSAGVTKYAVDTNGIGTLSTPNTSLHMLLHNGTYEVEIVSRSMKKTYVVTVEIPDIDHEGSMVLPDDTVRTGTKHEKMDELGNVIDTTYTYTFTAAVTGRTMTKPVIESQTESSVTIAAAGTGNGQDGVIEYGISNNENGPYTYQSTNVFSGISGTKYFKVKAYAYGSSLNTSESEFAEMVNLLVPTLELGGDVEITKGDSHVFIAAVTPAGFPSERISWTIAPESGTLNANTHYIKNADGSCTLTVATDESCVIILTAELLDADSQSYLNIISDSLRVIPTASGGSGGVSPSFTVTIPEALNIVSDVGSFRINGDTYNCVSETVSVRLDSHNSFKLISESNVALDYALYSDAELTSAISSGATIATFNPNASSMVVFYYTIDSSKYSGTYTDTLTFTVAFT